MIGNTDPYNVTLWKTGNHWALWQKSVWGVLHMWYSGTHYMATKESLTDNEPLQTHCNTWQYMTLCDTIQHCVTLCDRGQGRHYMGVEAALAVHWGCSLFRGTSPQKITAGDGLDNSRCHPCRIFYSLLHFRKCFHHRAILETLEKIAKYLACFSSTGSRVYTVPNSVTQSPLKNTTAQS